MKKIFLAPMMLLGMLLMSCSNDYDADTAESNYKPVEGVPMVASVVTTDTIDGKPFMWKHDFSYDIQGRVKEINTTVSAYRAGKYNNKIVYYKSNIVSRANYFYRGEELEVAYSFSADYPELPSYNASGSDSDTGVFNKNGVLSRFSSSDYEYTTNSLRRANTDGEVYYIIEHDDGGNVAGYKKYNTTTDKLISHSEKYFYISQRNNTNFDFSGYFGYWGVEQAVDVNSQPYYAFYQLAAFGMLGAKSPNLPGGVVEKDANGKDVYLYGEWTFDNNGLPLSYVDENGRKTIVSYVN